MVLAMTRPYPHSKTGVYWLRKVVPPPLRACLGKTELKESLRTKDPREAKAKAPAVLARFDALLAAARAGGNNLSQRDIEALCGEWYRAECAEYGDDPGSPEGWDESLSLLGDRLEDVDPDYDGSWERRLFLTPGDRAEAAALLTAHGHLAD